MKKLTDIYDKMISEGSLKDDPGQRTVLEELEKVNHAISKRKAKSLFFKKTDNFKGIYIWGGVGCGKSMLMDLFVKNLLVSNRRVHFHAFMQEIHLSLHKARSSGSKDPLAVVANKVIKNFKVLALDEMQIKDITDAMIVGRLFTLLLNGGVKIVTTSNRIPLDLYKNGLNRQLFLPFIYLIEEQLNILNLASKIDYRKNKLRGAPVYFTPIDINSKNKLDNLWKDLSGNENQDFHLVINKRKIKIPFYSNGVAKFTFFELCGENRGPADFLAIVDSVRVLVVENIPQLGRSNFNEAKRFVILIDTVYEAGITFICSAAAEPEYLYLEGEGVFEFERTVSRLNEMQSESWNKGRNLS
jgi:cell division protein ZapE